VNPDSRLTDEQLDRLEIITELRARLNVEVMTSDLVTIGHWVHTGTNIYGPVEGETVELEGDDAASWSPAVGG
jgi:hypothetical protein